MTNEDSGDLIKKIIEIYAVEFIEPELGKGNVAQRLIGGLEKVLGRVSSTIGEIRPQLPVEGDIYTFDNFYSIGDSEKRRVNRNTRAVKILNYFLSNKDKKIPISEFSEVTGLTRRSAGLAMNVLINDIMSHSKVYGIKIDPHPTHGLKKMYTLVKKTNDSVSV